MKSKLFQFLLFAGLLFALGWLFPPKLSTWSSEPVMIVKLYWQAYADQNHNQISNLVCSEFETLALMELDGLQLVKSKVDNLSCYELERDITGATVHCDGKIIVTYNNEMTEIDLSQRDVFVRNQKGDWFVCGYQ